MVGASNAVSSAHSSCRMQPIAHMSLGKAMGARLNTSGAAYVGVPACRFGTLGRSAGSGARCDRCAPPSPAGSGRARRRRPRAPLAWELVGLCMRRASPRSRTLSAWLPASANMMLLGFRSASQIGGGLGQFGKREGQVCNGRSSGPAHAGLRSAGCRQMPRLGSEHDHRCSGSCRAHLGGRRCWRGGAARPSRSAGTAATPSARAGAAWPRPAA